jgi:hypothetical protein
METRGQVNTKVAFSFFVVFVLLLLVSFYFPFLTCQKDFYIGDVSLYFEPLCRFIGESVRAGHLPLWNTLSYCGMPQIAIPSPGLFYLPNLVFAIVPFSQALAISLIFHQLIAAIGGYLLARSLNVSVTSAAACGILLALSGYMFSLEANYTLVANAAWLPLCLWSIKRIDSSFALTNCLRLVPCTIFVAHFLSCGRPEITGPGLIMLFACSLINLFFPTDEDRTKARIKFGFCTLSLFLAAMLAMPTILPALEWIPLSRRSQGMSTQEAFIYSANWYDYFSMIFGQALGDLHLRWAKFLNLVNTRPRLMPYLSTAYVGPIALTLAYWGLRGKHFPYKTLCLIALLVASVASLGDQTFVMPSLAQIFPALNVIRFPIKFLFFVVFFIAIFASFGLESVIKSELAKKTLVETVAIWLCGLIMGVVASNLAWPVLDLLLATHSKATPRLIIQEAQGLIGQHLIIGSLIGITIALLAFFRTKLESKDLQFAPAIVLLLSTSLMYTALTYLRHEAPIGFFNKKSSLATKIESLEGRNTYPRIAGLYLEQFTCPQLYGSAPKNLQAATINWSSYGLEMLRPNCHIDYKFPSIYGYEAAMTGKYYDLFLSVYLKSSQSLPINLSPVTDVPLANFLAMTSTKYVITQAYRYPGLGFPPKAIAPLDAKFFNLEHEDIKLNARVYSYKNSLPRSYFINSYRTVKDVPIEIENSETTQFDPQLVALLEPKNTISQNPSTIIFKPLVIEVDKPEFIQLKADCPEAGLVVLTDQYYPGWQCFVDGKQNDLLQANSFARAVFVQKGLHTISFQYKPMSLSIAFCLAILAVALLAILLIYSAYRTSKQQKQ